jgi:hypothetical protein
MYKKGYVARKIRPIPLSCAKFSNASISYSLDSGLTGTVSTHIAVIVGVGPAKAVPANTIAANSAPPKTFLKSINHTFLSCARQGAENRGIIPLFPYI